MSKKVTVNDKMQTDYVYELVEPEGKNFAINFTPDLTPKQMLTVGVFGGKYMTDCQKEFPKDWFKNAKFCPLFANPKLNCFKVNASQSLSVWRKKGWLYKDDPRGWFQWYCRYFLGRRLNGEDKRQIRRWRAMRRHVAQLEKNCKNGDLSCRRVQRQTLLHWAYDSRKI